MSQERLAYVLSVPHMGTHWTMELLKGAGFVVKHTHCTTVGRGWVDQGRLVVIPWRNPVLARISEINRINIHKNGGSYPKVHAGNINYIKTFWDKVNVFVLPIPPVERQIRALASFYGMERDSLNGDIRPLNTSKDVTGFKRRYMAGEEDLLSFFKQQLQSGEISTCQEACCAND